MKLRNLFIALAAAATAIASPVAAQAQSKAIALEGSVEHLKQVTDENGATHVERVKPELIVPGDRLAFSVRYTNASEEVVTDFVVTNPLPNPVRLADDADPDLNVSVDGGESWGKLAALSVTDETGTARAATSSDVTHVRWTLASVKPGETGRLEFPAIIR